ncbi:MAG: sigma-54 interaction domain-containing protein [Casimicrobiaceae bacterium]
MTQPPEALAAYLETLPEPHILIDEDYRIVTANAAYRRAFGARTRLEGAHCYRVSHGYEVPCDQAGETCPLARARLSRAREHVLHRHHTPEGERYVQIDLAPLRTQAGDFFVERIEPLAIEANTSGQAEMVGRSPAFLVALDLIARAGPSNAAVLLLGESGTGKELAARAVHAASPRRHRPFVVVDCASLTGTLFESELFGHQRGAFTGALTAKPGLAEVADGGTLFLDELGDIPLEMQVKLLRLIETGTYRRVGSTELRKSDLRFVSATHRDLAALVREGRFREDLYHRISVFPIRLPALRERREDVPELALALLDRLSPGKTRRLTAAAVARLAAHPFPGNIRELRNVIERATLLTADTEIGADIIEQALRLGAPLAPPVARVPAASTEAIGRTDPTSPTDALTDQALAALAARYPGSRRDLARELGMSERTLYRRLKRAGQPRLDP